MSKLREKRSLTVPMIDAIYTVTCLQLGDAFIIPNKLQLEKDLLRVKEWCQQMRVKRRIGKVRRIRNKSRKSSTDLLTESPNKLN